MLINFKFEVLILNTTCDIICVCIWCTNKFLEIEGKSLNFFTWHLIIRDACLYLCNPLLIKFKVMQSPVDKTPAAIYGIFSSWFLIFVHKKNQLAGISPVWWIVAINKFGSVYTVIDTQLCITTSYAWKPVSLHLPYMNWGIKSSKVYSCSAWSIHASTSKRSALIMYMHNNGGMEFNGNAITLSLCCHLKHTLQKNHGHKSTNPA